MDESAAAITTRRLRLAPATDAMIAAELEGPDRLAEVLGAVVPPDWPPRHHDVDTLAFWRDALRQPCSDGWWLHYVLRTEANRTTLVGSVGYKGPPSDGVVEIGYSVVPSWQRRGLATEACRALIESAWRRRAEVVVAHTLEGLEPSIGVLRKLGFAAVDSQKHGELAFALRRPER
jgi:RimJ/RimL family protein N-acetyltransferase